MAKGHRLLHYAVNSGTTAKLAEIKCSRDLGRLTCCRSLFNCLTTLGGYRDLPESAMSKFRCSDNNLSAIQYIK